MIPGEIITAPGDIALNAGRDAVEITVANKGDRPVQVGSHYHFAETNPLLDFDRAKARGCRLDIAAGTAVPGHFDVHFGYQRTGGVEHLQAAGLRFTADRLRHAMGTEDDRRADRNLIELFNEYRTAGAQIVDHELVVHDFMAHVNRCTQHIQRTIDDFNGAVDTGAETPRVGKYDIHGDSGVLSGTKLKTIKSTAATLMAESARLNTGQWKSRQYQCTKSTT